MPDPTLEEEVNIQLSWTADCRTELAIRRQANLMGFETTADYITQTIARALASNDEEMRPGQNGGKRATGVSGNACTDSGRAMQPAWRSKSKSR